MLNYHSWFNNTVLAWDLALRINIFYYNPVFDTKYESRLEFKMSIVYSTTQMWISKQIKFTLQLRINYRQWRFNLPEACWASRAFARAFGRWRSGHCSGSPTPPDSPPRPRVPPTRWQHVAAASRGQCRTPADFRCSSWQS